MSEVQDRALATRSNYPPGTTQRHFTESEPRKEAISFTQLCQEDERAALKLLRQYMDLSDHIHHLAELVASMEERPPVSGDHQCMAVMNMMVDLRQFMEKRGIILAGTWTL